MNHTAQGRIHEIFDEQQVSEKFRKREFVLEIPDGSYTQFVKFQCTQDKCDEVGKFQVGDNVTVDFNLQGKPFTKNGNTMYFNNLGAWRISLDVDKPKADNLKDSIPAYQDETGDLPF